MGETSTESLHLSSERASPIPEKVSLASSRASASILFPSILVTPSRNRRPPRFHGYFIERKHKPSSRPVGELYRQRCTRDKSAARGHLSTSSCERVFLRAAAILIDDGFPIGWPRSLSLLLQNSLSGALLAARRAPASRRRVKSHVSALVGLRRIPSERLLMKSDRRLSVVFFFFGRAEVTPPRAILLIYISTKQKNINIVSIYIYVINEESNSQTPLS